MKKTALHSIHLSLNAKMVPFAGFEMPVQYSGIQKEHLAVRHAVGLFDVSHMGEFIISGKDALNLIQKITSNDASKLKIGGIQYSTLLRENAGIVDDLLVYRLDDEEYLLVVNAANIEKDWNFIQSYAKGLAVSMQDKSGEISLLALQGPKAKLVLKKLTSVDLENLPYYHFTIGEVAGISNVIISNTGYTGAGGYELYVPNQHATSLWQSLIQSGDEFGILPCGLAARDTLRLEKGFCLYGNDINDETTPLEAGLNWIVKLNKEEDFNGKSVLLKQKSEGVSKKLCGFVMLEKAIPRSGYEIFNAENQKIGMVTSGTLSPSLEKGIGLGYLPVDYSKETSKIFVDIRGKKIPAEVIKVPFL